MSTLNLSSINFYDKFHKTTRSTSKFISSKNFTYENIINIVSKEIGNFKDITILDYGCGSGSLSFFLAKMGAIVTGFDVSKKAIKSCNESLKKNKLSNIKFFDKETNINDNYDYIISIEVIEHIQNDWDLISYFYKILKNKGKIILSTPSNNAPLYKLNLLNDFDKNVGHLRRYSPELLIKIFSNSKFNNIKFYKNEGILRNLLFTMPILGKLIKFIKWPISTWLNKLDRFTISLFGESDLIIVATKP